MASSEDEDRDDSLTLQLEEARRAYDRQKSRTSKASNKLKDEVTKLSERVNIPAADEANLRNGKNVPRSFEMPDDDTEHAHVKKLLFLNAQASIAYKILGSLLAQDATWDQQDFLADPTAERIKERIEHYRTATRLLSNIERNFKQAVAMEAKYFGPVWQASMNIIKNYPYHCSGVVVSAGVLGGLAGGGLVTLNVGFRAFLATLFGEASVLSGTLVGGLAGIVVAGGIVLLIALYQRRTRSQEEADSEDLRVMKERIATIANKDLQQNDLTELEDLFHVAFHEPMKLAITESCPICFEHFPADGGCASTRAIKAPNCQGNHMTHHKCFREWQWKCGSDKCVICRQ